MAEYGSWSALLVRNWSNNQIWLRVSDHSTGAVSDVALPVDSAAGWDNASYVLSNPSELWVFAGSGPMYLRQYHLAGSSLPTSAELVSTRTYGDADSRAGDLLRLSSGGLFGVWHQQGSTTPQGHSAFYRSAAGTTQTFSFAFMPTRASKDALVQHPADGSIWMFANADAMGRIGAAHFTESALGVRLDWTDGYFVAEADGAFDADPENPSVAAAPDPASGKVVLAYQTATRARFGTSTIGSYPAIARIGADGSKTFTHLPTYVERVSSLGLSVRSGEVWLAHRPVDPNTYTYNELHVSRYSGSRWSSVRLGTTYAPQVRTQYAPGAGEFAALMSDLKTHQYSAR